MLIPLVDSHTNLQLLVLFTLSQLILARIPIVPLAYSQFANSFNLYPLSGNGGCNRDSPDGLPMLQHTLKSLGGAWAIAETVVQDLPNYPTQIYIRGLLYQFFGILFQENHQLNPHPDNVAAYNLIANTFNMINKLFTDPGYNLYNLKPRYRCLEDYASYFTHMEGSDGQQDTSLPLVGEYFDVIVDGGLTRPPPYNDIWPGLMFVNNRALDGTAGWYLPQAASPSSGGCGYPALNKTTAFTDCRFNKNSESFNPASALYGVTVCPVRFEHPTLLDLGTPIPNGGMPEVEKFQVAADVGDLHEFVHLVSDGVIIDQPAVTPPVADPLTTNQWTTNRNWATWISSTVYQAYGFFYTSFLGFIKPYDALLNADSYALFGMCMYYPELDCLSPNFLVGSLP